MSRFMEKIAITKVEGTYIKMINSISKADLFILDDFGLNRVIVSSGLISLSKRYGNERFENACKRALTGPKVTYGIIENILQKNLDLQTTIYIEQEYIPNHENVRGKSFYA